jgi:uncharacterized membrane protein required for colicin V production
VHWLDLVLAAYLVLGALYGFRHGLVWVGFSLIGYIAGIVVADHTAKPLTRLVTAALPLHRWVDHYVPQAVAAMSGARLQAWTLAHAILSLLLFLLIVGAMEFVGRSVGNVASQGVRVFRLTAALNRIGGIAMGIIEHGLVAGLVMALVLAVPAARDSMISRSIHHAPIANMLIHAFHRVVKIPGGQYL